MKAHGSLVRMVSFVPYEQPPTKELSFTKITTEIARVAASVPQPTVKPSKNRQFLTCPGARARSKRAHTAAMIMTAWRFATLCESKERDYKSKHTCHPANDKQDGVQKVTNTMIHPLLLLPLLHNKWYALLQLVVRMIATLSWALPPR